MMLRTIPTAGGTNDLATTIRIAKKVVRRGMKFLLDLHYSDFWCRPLDPSQAEGVAALDR